MRLSTGEASVDEVEGLNAFLYKAPAPPSIYHQYPTCSTIQVQDMPYLDDDWNFWNASNDMINNPYQPPSQYSIGNLGGMEQPTFEGDTSSYDGCQLSVQYEAQHDPSNSRPPEFEPAQANISIKLPKSPNSSQTFQSLERADPTITMDMNAAIDHDGASPSDFPKFVPSLPSAVSAAPPKTLRRKISKAFHKEIAENRKENPGICIRCHCLLNSVCLRSNAPG